MVAENIAFLRMRGHDIVSYKTVYYSTYDCKMGDGSRVLYYGCHPLITVKDDTLTIRPYYPFMPSQLLRINQFIAYNFPNWMSKPTKRFVGYRHTSYKWYFTIGGKDYLFHMSKMNKNVFEMKPFRIKNGIPMDVPSLDTYDAPAGKDTVNRW